MTTSELNRETNMPHRVTIGDVLASIEVTPGEATAFLTHLADQFIGGAQHNLGRALRDHAAMVANPQTYGYRAPEQVAATDAPEYMPPSAPVYAQKFGGANVDAGVASEQRREPAAQGQATTFQTMRTGLADASRNQGSNDPNASFTSPAVGDVSLSDDERRTYSHPQGGALDRLALQQRDERIADLEKQLAAERDRGAKTPTSDAGGFTVRSEPTRPEDIP